MCLLNKWSSIYIVIVLVEASMHISLFCVYFIYNLYFEVNNYAFQDQCSAKHIKGGTDSMIKGENPSAG